jgi:hypothetical protein
MRRENPDDPALMTLPDKQVTPQRVRTAIALDELRHPVVREALETWQRLRGVRRMPARADMTPRAMKGFLKYMTLAQALDGGRNFYFRVSGDQVNIQQGMMLQGLTTEEIDARIAGFGAQLARLYARAMRRREVCAYRGLYFRPGDKHTFSHEAIMAPLGDDGETPDHVIVVAA